MKRTAIVLALALAATPAYSQSGQKVRLFRDDLPAAGTKARESVEIGMRRLQLKAEAGGESLFEARFTGIGRMVHDLEFRSPDEVVLKVRRNRFATRTDGASLPGEEDVDVNALEGCTLHGKRSDGQWAFKLAEGKPTEEQTKEIDDLNQDFDNDAAVYPSEPIGVGHTWKITGSRLAGLLGGRSGLDNLDGEMNLKLEDIETRDGVECARIAVEGTASFDFSTDDDDGGAALPTMKATLKLKGTVWRSLVHGADLRGDLKGDMTIAGASNTEGLAFQLSMQGPVTLSATTDVSPEATEAPLPDEDETDSSTPKPRTPRQFD